MSKSWSEEMVYRYQKEIQLLTKERNKLKKELSISNNALKLACERVKYFEEMQDREMGVVEFFGQEIDYDLQAIIEQYKEQSEEMMKSE